jgi:hypothetical protein
MVVFRSVWTSELLTEQWSEHVVIQKLELEARFI